MGKVFYDGLCENAGFKSLMLIFSILIEEGL